MFLFKDPTLSSLCLKHKAKVVCYPKGRLTFRMVLTLLYFKLSKVVNSLGFCKYQYNRKLKSLNVIILRLQNFH